MAYEKKAVTLSDGTTAIKPHYQLSERSTLAARPSKVASLGNRCPLQAGCCPSARAVRTAAFDAEYARILGHWVDELGLVRDDYGAYSMRRTKAALIYRRTNNLRAVQLLLGHSKLESTVRYLDIEVDYTLKISERTEI